MPRRRYLSTSRRSFILLSFSLMPLLVAGQTRMQAVGGHQYGLYGDRWYTVVNGERGDLVDTKHVIVRPKVKSRFSAFDFAKAGLPQLKTARGEFAGGYYELEVPLTHDPFTVSRALLGTDDFDEVMFNVFYAVDSTPNDTRYANQWGLTKVQMNNAWDITTGSSAILVAVIDVGADYEHEDLIGNLWNGVGYDFYDNDDDPYPSDNARHGTAVAGIISARTNNGIGVAGGAGGWGATSGPKIMHFDAGYRDMYGEEYVDLATVCEAIDSAAAWGARVVNMSFGGGSWSFLETTINNAVTNHNVVFVAAAGNYNSGQSTAVKYPAAYSKLYPRPILSLLLVVRVSNQVFSSECDLPM
jgi:subtilisin family serine protease